MTDKGRSRERAPGEKTGLGSRTAKLAAACYWASTLSAVAWSLWGRDFVPGATIITIEISALLTGLFIDHRAHLHRLAAAAALAYHDELTGLPNRRSFMETLTAALSAGKGEGLCAVLFLDIDRFKLINDTLGHPAGDRLLKIVGERIRKTLAGKATVSRFGGDEFTMLIEGTTPETAVELAQKVIHDLNLPLTIDNQEIWPNASIGIAFSNSSRPSSDELLRRADIALYEAKQRGKGSFHIYAATESTPMVRSLSMENELRMAVQLGQMRLHYQPVVDLQSSRIIGMEALVRWQHPRLGLLNPADFIPLAEETGLIRPLGEWIFAEACKKTRDWQELYGQNFNVSINLSALQFSHLGFLAQLSSVMGATGVRGRNIQLEITETALMEHEPGTVENLERLRGMGIRVAIDDFGIGYSSMSYLQRFDVDVLKIDQSFVRDSGNERTLSIIGAIVSLAHALGMKVVAEGIEDEGQLARLRVINCDMGQGFLLSRPLIERDMNRLLASGATFETGRWDTAPPRAA